MPSSYWNAARAMNAANMNAGVDTGIEGSWNGPRGFGLKSWSFEITTAGAGAVPTNIFAAVSSTTSVLAVTGDIKSEGDWTTVNTISSHDLTAPVAITTPGTYYVLFLQVGAWGTTQMAMGRVSGAHNIPATNFFPQATFGTGQTALPAVSASPGTISSSGAFRYWAGVS
jgi:hypothetical protein